MGKPWWAKVEDPEAAANTLRTMGINSGLRAAWLNSNRTRLDENPELASAVYKAGVDYPTARRLDMAYQASAAQKKRDQQRAAGLTQQAMHPDDHAAAKAADHAQKSWARKHFKSNSFWDIGKGTLTAGLDVLQVAMSPLTTPIAAGAADRGGWQMPDMADSIGPKAEVFGSAVQAGSDWVHGLGRIIGVADTTEAQAADMKRAGYDADDWKSRYNWYLDLHTSPGQGVSQKNVNELKQEFDAGKVDIAREIITSGVMQDMGRREGLSKHAQDMMAAISANEDPEAGEIMKRLGDHMQLTFGGTLADNAHLTPGTGSYTAMAILGELAAEWYAGPEIVAGKALKEMRYARYGASLEPEAVKAALVADGRVARRLDDALEQIDTIYHLDQAGDVAGVAREKAKFDRVHAGWAPHYDLLYGMRQGSVQGAVFGKPRIADGPGDVGDLAPINITRVSDPAKFKPIFELRQTPGTSIDAITRGNARAAVAERISDALIVHQMGTGKPIVHNKMLLPGQIRVSGNVRQALEPVFRAINGAEKGLLRELDTVRGAVVTKGSALNMGTDAAAHLLTSAEGGKWVRKNYTKGGPRARMARGLSRVRVFEDAAHINFTDTESTKKFADFVRFFMPKAQTDFLAHSWAKADPARRKALLEGTFEAIANARLAKANPRSEDFYRQWLKGQESVYRPGDKVHETYSTRLTDLIPLGNGDRLAAAMYSTQFANGVNLPSIKEVVQNTEWVGFFGSFVGAMNHRFMDTFARVIKTGQVATTSNLARQVIEGRMLEFLSDPAKGLATTGARAGLAGRVAGARATTNQAARDAKRLVNEGHGGDLADLVAAGKTDDYLQRVAAELGEQLGSRRVAAIGAMLESGMDVRQVANLRSRARLTVTWPVDLVRRAREHAYGNLSRKYVDQDSWANRIDEDLAARMYQAVIRELGGAADSYAHGSGLTNTLTELNEGVGRGLGVAGLNLRNTFGYLGTMGDSGAHRWADALNTRLADPIGRMVARAIAVDVTRGKGSSRRKISNVEIVKRRIAAEDARGMAFPDDKARKAWIRSGGRFAGVAATNIEDLIAHALKNFDEGQAYRLNGMRAKYLGGKVVESPAEFDEALKVWAVNMVDDMGTYLGGKRLTNGDWQFDPAHAPLLKAMQQGPKTADMKLLSGIEEAHRPAEVASRILVSRQILEGENFADTLSNLSSKAYSFVVSNPLQRLTLQPQMLAARHEALELQRPLRDALKARGMSDDTIEAVLDGNAYRYATKRVFRFSDNAREQTYFSALVNNFLWYERATEDFARRFMNVTKADPALLGRGYVLTEASEHAGIIHQQKGSDENGNETSELVFVYPGSGLLTRTVVKAGVNLGIADSDLVAVPYWTDFSAPVRYLSPSLANPIGFTTSPLVGMPLRAMRSVFPESTLHIDSTLAMMEGGERSFAGQGLGESLLPVPLRRMYNTYFKGDESQVASAMRNAMVYMDAAGKIPGADATPEERQEAMDTLRQQVTNVMMLRTIFASFAPAAPGMSTDPSGLGEVNTLDAMRGIDSVRGEWFALLEEMTQKHGADQAFSHASIEWLRRKEGSVLNPTAFTTGSSRAPGAEQEVGGFSSNRDLTQWMLNNQKWIRAHGDAAYKLLPTVGGEKYYDSVAYRVQLRTGLRKHRSAEDLYKALIYNQVQSDWYNESDRRDARLASASGKSEEARIWAEWNAFDKQMETANPLWATMRAEKYTPEQVHSNIAPNVRAIADDPNLPAEIKPLQDDIKVMAELYDEYRSKSTNLTGRGGDAFTARRDLNAQYRQRGNDLFLGTKLDALWKSMRVKEDE